ncbi:b08deb3a-55ea-435e-8b65-a2c9d3fa6d4e [Sclerotinia trifoliorum]|uniref:B08deb3a-55ea-435e-8b65-a2c9d3fa6d4e n=1 Tax=Sclerotinia trifoliorum TaxID=28548 RepID=A0A8H2ZNC0_9HELO|nr:b08deb3a-55ea-435e-8b65-a2c9d3fa6d4e [Sclerotinia trifoliorum]
MVDFAKYRVVDLKKLLLARQLPTNGLKATLVERLTQSDALHVSIEEVINGGVKQEISSTVPPTQAEHAIGNAKRQNLHDAMDPLKNIPGFTPTSAGHMILKQENTYTSPQIQNLKTTPTTYSASQSSPYTNLDTVQFRSLCVGDTHQRQPLTTLQNNQALPPSSFETRTRGNTKVQIKSEMSTSESPFNSSLPDLALPKRRLSRLPQPHRRQQMSKPDIPNDLQSLQPMFLIYRIIRWSRCIIQAAKIPRLTKKSLHAGEWLVKLVIDVNPFNFVFVDPLQRDRVEVHWALKSPEIRRDIEKKAI